MHCAKDCRYIIKYFEVMINNIFFSSLPEFHTYLVQTKNESFIEDHVAKDTVQPTVKVNVIKKEYRDFTISENATYYKEYIGRKLTRKEM